MIPPPKKTNRDFLQRTLYGCSTQGRILLEKKAPIYYPACKGLSIDGVGVSRDTPFQETRPGVGFETGDFVEEKLGGATVVRLKNAKSI